MQAIVCISENWGIGCDGQLLFRISADLKRFRALTTGKTVILGSRTLATFPGGKPLPAAISSSPTATSPSRARRSRTPLSRPQRLPDPTRSSSAARASIGRFSPIATACSSPQSRPVPRRTASSPISTPRPTGWRCRRAKCSRKTVCASATSIISANKRGKLPRAGRTANNFDTRKAAGAAFFSKEVRACPNFIPTFATSRAWAKRAPKASPSSASPTCVRFCPTSRAPMRTAAHISASTS